MHVRTFAAAALAVGAVAIGVLAAADYEPVAAQTKVSVDVANLTRTDGLGSWVSACEHVERTGNRVAKGNISGADCHLRYVDVPDADNPDASSILAFVVPDRTGLRVEFGVADGLSFKDGGFYLSRDGFPVWRLDKYGCLESGVCTFTGPAADALIKAFSDQNGETLEMRIVYTDPTGIVRDRHWPMLPFASAFDQFMASRDTITAM